MDNSCRSWGEFGRPARARARAMRFPNRRRAAPGVEKPFRHARTCGRGGAGYCLPSAPVRFSVPEFPDVAGRCAVIVFSSTPHNAAIARLVSVPNSAIAISTQRGACRRCCGGGRVCHVRYYRTCGTAGSSPAGRRGFRGTLAGHSEPKNRHKQAYKATTGLAQHDDYIVLVCARLF